MLIGNGSPRHASPLRYYAGTGIMSNLAVLSGNYYGTGARRGFYDSQATSGAQKAAVPEGYVHPVAWMLAPKGGGMASRGRITGSGDLTAANLAGGLNGQAGLSGAGDITDAALALIVSAVANLVGSGDITADIVGKLEASADLAGSGDLTAALAALADLVADLSGAGALTAGATAIGDMSADIVVTGDLLSTANVGAAVWEHAVRTLTSGGGGGGLTAGDVWTHPSRTLTASPITAAEVWQHLIETGYTAEELLRIIAAAAAGKSAGAGTGTSTYRDMNDTKDRITATIAGNNRVNVTRDGS